MDCEIRDSSHIHGNISFILWQFCYRQILANCLKSIYEQGIFVKRPYCFSSFHNSFQIRITRTEKNIKGFQLHQIDCTLLNISGKTFNSFMSVYKIQNHRQHLFQKKKIANNMLYIQFVFLSHISYRKCSITRR